MIVRPAERGQRHQLAEPIPGRATPCGVLALSSITITLRISYISGPEQNIIPLLRCSAPYP
jgi:hypothetical protein